MPTLDPIITLAAECGCGSIANHSSGGYVLAFHDRRNMQHFITRAQAYCLGTCGPVFDSANACILVPTKYNCAPDDPAREMSIWSLRPVVWEEVMPRIYNYLETSSPLSVEGNEHFAAVAIKLFEQGVPSAIQGRCKYRGPNGLVCAYGARIPDDKYDPRMDQGMSVEDIVKEWLPEHAPHIPLFQALQHVHDCNVGDAYRTGDWSKTFWASSETMRAGLLAVALVFKLCLSFELLDSLSFPENRELGGHRNG